MLDESDDDQESYYSDAPIVKDPEEEAKRFTIEIKEAEVDIVPINETITVPDEDPHK